MGRLTTHVLDTSHGKPGSGIRVELWRVDGERRALRDVHTNSDGRCDKPLLEGDDPITINLQLLPLPAGSGSQYDERVTS